MYLVSLLFLIPLGMVYLFYKLEYKKIWVWLIAFCLIVSYISGRLFLSEFEILSLHVGSFGHLTVFILDISLIFYFIKEGFSKKSKKVWWLALVQLTMLMWAELVISSDHQSFDIVIDELSLFMFTIINIVGSLIVLFGWWYMDKEDISVKKKKLFLSYLAIFLTVMNLIVSANSLMLFFLLFELTTLASYLLIGFRKDDESVANALKALWMNQIGGILILSAIIYGSYSDVAPYFSSFISFENVLFGVALLAMAGLVKGAQLPFDGWLLGAMVAPTPVSAILHSATMVKIAPFVVMKLTPALQNSIVGDIIVCFGAFVFVVAGIYGLSKDKFKEILGYSTIALLGLMASMAVVLGEEHRWILYILIFFHAVSKALLFLLAGILEKNYHIKYVSQMDELLQKAPVSVAMIMFGFATITLPPFGLFFGKLFSIEFVAQNLHGSFSSFVLVVSLAIGSAVLTLLYFKVASAMFSKNANSENFDKEKLFSKEMFVPLIYTFLLIGSAFMIIDSGINIPYYYVIFSLIMVFSIPLWLKLDPFKGVDRVKEYSCGEQSHFQVAQFSFEISSKIKNSITLFSIILYSFIALGGL